MKSNNAPLDLNYQRVNLYDSSRNSTPGVVAYRNWSSRESFIRGFKKSAKIVGILVSVTLPFAFLEPFAFLAWGSVTLSLIILGLGPYLHLKYWGEQRSFFYVQAVCPYCKKNERLTPYLSTALTKEFTLLCPACGQTSSAALEEL